MSIIDAATLTHPDRHIDALMLQSATDLPFDLAPSREIAFVDAGLADLSTLIEGL